MQAAWLQMKFSGHKLKPRLKLDHENRRALKPENSTIVNILELLQSKLIEN